MVSLKNVMRGVFVAAAASAAMAAQADVALPTSGNGELTLFVRDEVTGNVYARGLGDTLDSIATQAVTGGAYSGPTTVAYTLASIPHDANLTDFLATTTGHGVTWAIETADTLGSNLATAPRRVAFTTNNDIVATASIPSNATLISTVASINSLLTGVNANLPDTAGSSVYGLDNVGGQFADPNTVGEGAEHLYGAGVITTANIGESLSLYLLTSSGTGTPTGQPGNVARVFQATSLILEANGDLHAVASAPAVPLPAAVWLFGSGLLGLVGVGRRRRVEEAASAA